MPNTIVIGMQWGDEGKGKDIDILSEQHDVIVRYQGGGNAGHTVVIGDKKYALHLIPSGILRRGKLNIIGNNVVIDPVKFLEEVDNLKTQGIEVTPENLLVSDKCHLTLRYHNELDKAKGKAIGTTGRGIGPTYSDKALRIGIRICDLFNLKGLEEKVTENARLSNHILGYYNAPLLIIDEVLDGILKSREGIMPFVKRDVGGVILENNGSLLFEGAQGTLLDIDHGTYPFVTSSNTTIGGAYTGTGVYVDFDKRIGILKAYTTRVGNGPFPTEQDNETGKRFRKIGNEFGTTTGRPRRCGWLDLFAAKYAARINGINEISLTKLDVLSEEKEIKICTAYRNEHGITVDYFPSTDLDNYLPVYETLPGWNRDIIKARKASELPKEAMNYIKTIEDFLEVPIKRVGVGERRDQTIEL
jgi:adenylosuccinate synthase